MALARLASLSAPTESWMQASLKLGGVAAAEEAAAALALRLLQKPPQQPAPTPTPIMAAAPLLRHWCHAEEAAVDAPARRAAHMAAGGERAAAGRR